jgi:hypothetical protein
MKSIAYSIYVLGSLSLVTACGSTPSQANADAGSVENENASPVINLLYTGEVNGYLEPCG